MSKRAESNAKEDIVYTGKTMMEKDFVEAQLRSHDAKQENTPEAWRDFHLWVDLIAVSKYGLPQRTGRYGLTTKGEFTHTLDSIPKKAGNMEPPPPPPGGMSDDLNENDFSEADR